MPIGVISHLDCQNHDMGDYHPESPARLSAIQDQIISSGLDLVVRQYDAHSIDREWLMLAHNKDYVDYIFNNAPLEGSFALDADTIMSVGTLDAALLAAGAAIDAVDLVMQKEISAAFCATRPPGHHAERDKAMGFCIFNNIAIAAAYAKHTYNLKRVAIVDFDVHHGNGTENILKDKQGYLFCSTFQHPFYPFSGSGKQPSHIINSPLSATSSSEEFRQIVTEDWMTELEQFKPEMVFISAGFDGHVEDEISQMALFDEDYRWVTQQLRTIADTHAEGRIVSVLEGGYALSALGRSVVAHLKGLIGE